MKPTLLLLALAAAATACSGCAPGAQPAPEDKAPPAQAPAGAGEQPRKIIYNARIDLVVEDFAKAQDDLARLVDQYKGSIAQSDTRGASGSPRSGDWTLRVPAAALREFVADLSKLGAARESKIDSDDITDRYYDLKAHIQNDQAEEEALRKLMTEKSDGGKLEDLLAVRRELRELRGTIDSQQGQMQRWDKEVALATVVVEMRDRKDYVPAASPSFGTSIGRTWQDSLDALLGFGKGAVLLIVAAAPWLAVLAAPALAAWWWARKRLKKARGRAVQVLPAAPPPAAS